MVVNGFRISLPIHLYSWCAGLKCNYVIQKSDMVSIKISLINYNMHYTDVVEIRFAMELLVTCKIWIPIHKAKMYHQTMRVLLHKCGQCCYITMSAYKQNHKFINKWLSLRGNGLCTRNLAPIVPFYWLQRTMSILLNFWRFCTNLQTIISIIHVHLL